MSKTIFTAEQLQQLLKNESVYRCSERSITYSKTFKIKAVRQYEAGLTAREIFEEAGFNLQTIGRAAPRDCLKRWNKIYRISGVAGLSSETRGGGGRPKTKYQTDKEQIKYLEAQVAYLKAENDFLAKLRAGKKR